VLLVKVNGDLFLFFSFFLKKKKKLRKRVVMLVLTEDQWEVVDAVCADSVKPITREN